MSALMEHNAPGAKSQTAHTAHPTESAKPARAQPKIPSKFP